MTDVEHMLKRAVPHAVKERARLVLRTYGGATAGFRHLPDYLIIGAKRSGTTSLWRNLHLHPQVQPMFPSWENLKSPHYFDIHFARGERWYRSHFPVRRPGTLCGDASPYYLFHPRAAERVHRTGKDFRVIVLLRDPVDRAWSHYRERVDAGTEKLDFAAAIAEEGRRLEGEEARMMSDPGYYSWLHDHCSYLARGRYWEQLSRWMSVCGRDNVHVIRSEDMYSDPRQTLHEVHRFLGLTPVATRFDRLRHMNRLPDPRMPDEVYDQLSTYYRPHVVELEKHLGRKFAWRSCA